MELSGKGKCSTSLRALTLAALIFGCTAGELFNKFVISNAKYFLSFPVTSYEDSEREWNVGLPSYFDI